MENLIEVDGLSELEPELTTADVNQILLAMGQRDKTIAERKVKFDEEVAFAQLLLAEAKKNFNADTEDARNERNSLAAQLESYYAKHPPMNGRKFLKFAGGQFGYNDGQTKYFFNDAEVKDNPEFLAFVQEHYPEFIKLKPSVDWSAFKKKLAVDGETVSYADTGEIVSGLRAQRTFSAKPITL